MTSLVDYVKANRAILASTSPEVLALLVRIKAEQLYPAFLEQLVVALENALAAGYSFWITCGERTWPEQAALFQKGRRGIKGEGIVTKVDAGFSAHNYGIAADAAYDLDPDQAGLQPSWEKSWLQHWADAAVEAGLDAGYYWKNFFDGPHVQLNIAQHDITTKQLRSIYLKGGKLDVFQYLDRYTWS